MTQAEIDTSKPHAARIYDYLLGGKDHFAIDRETAEKGIKLIPTGRTAARENRTFLGRPLSAGSPGNRELRHAERCHHGNRPVTAHRERGDRAAPVPSDLLVVLPIITGV